MDLVQNRQCAFKDVLGLETCFGLLSGQSVPILLRGRKRRFNADRHVLSRPVILWVPFAIPA